MHKKIIMLMILASFLLSSCGTLLYPERRNQHIHNTSRIDAGVAVLDSIGLIFFLVPGVVALAIDFTTGAIYLPTGAKSEIFAENNAILYMSDGLSYPSNSTQLLNI